MSTDARLASDPAAARSAPLGDLLGDLRSGLETTARGLDLFQLVVLDLVRKAGAYRDVTTIEEVQRIDALVQQLHRLRDGVEGLVAAVRTGGAADLTLTVDDLLLHKLSQAAMPAGDSGDCDFF